MSGKPMTEEVTAQPLGVSQKQGSEEAAAGGAGRGEGAQWSGRCPRPSGLGDLLTPGRAGREPGGGALLRAEAVLVLQEGRGSQHRRNQSTLRASGRGLVQRAGLGAGRGGACTAAGTAPPLRPAPAPRVRGSSSNSTQAAVPPARAPPRPAPPRQTVRITGMKQQQPWGSAGPT